MLTPETSYASLFNQAMVDEPKYRNFDVFSVSEERTDQLLEILQRRIDNVFEEEKKEGSACMAKRIKVMLEGVDEFAPSTPNEVAFALFTIGESTAEMHQQLQKSNRFAELMTSILQVGD